MIFVWFTQVFLCKNQKTALSLKLLGSQESIAPFFHIIPRVLYGKMGLYFPENPIVLKIELFFVFYTKPLAKKLKFTENRVFNRSRRLRGVRSSYLNRILMKIYSFGKPCQILYFEKFAFYYSSNFEPFCCFSQ